MPESVYAYAPIWASLSEHARLFAVDLPRSWLRALLQLCQTLRVMQNSP
jgi:hypothetical protein